MNKLFFTGDTHGDEKIFISKETKSLIGEGDYLIVCGDFGLIWFDKDVDERNWRKQEKRLDILSELSCNILFIDGNHENFVFLNKYPIVNYKGGKAHKIRDNVYHLMRGEVFIIAEKKIFAFGGAESIDRANRKEWISWWEEEYPNLKEYENGMKNLNKHSWKVDYIVTHDCPLSILDKMYKYSWLEKFALNKYLDILYKKCDFKNWWFGHHHRNEKFGDNIECLYKNIVSTERKVTDKDVDNLINWLNK